MEGPEDEESKAFEETVSSLSSPDEMPGDFGDYGQRLIEAQTTDFGGLEYKGVVGLGVDNIGRPAVYLIPALALKECTNDAEKMEMMRKIMLLFVRIVDTLVNNPYTLVYGHSATPLLAQTKVLHNYYKILPRKYKKNLKELVLIHPTFGIKTFFDISRYFVGEKFFRKLHYVDRIAQFQRVVSPLLIRLPVAFIQWEERHFRYNRPTEGISPLIQLVHPGDAAPKFLISCTEYLRQRNAFAHEGLFRVPGDQELMNLALDRLRIDAGERSILFPTVEPTEKVAEEGEAKMEDAGAIDETDASIPKSQVSARVQEKRNAVLAEAQNFPLPLQPAEDTSERAVLVIDDINSVASVSVCDFCKIFVRYNCCKNNVTFVLLQMFKGFISNLPEPLICYDSFAPLINAARELEVKVFIFNTSFYLKTNYKLRKSGNLKI